MRVASSATLKRPHGQWCLSESCGVHVPSALRQVGRALLFAMLGIAAIVRVPWAFDAVRMQDAAEHIGPQAAAAVPALQGLLRDSSSLEDAAALVAVNAWFNRRIVFRADIEVWGLQDYWASPLELLDKGQGDCEDYAIAKYFSLLASGMPANRLRLVYVRLLQGGDSQAHMVLAYYARPSAEPLILDSLVDELRPASRRPDLTPVFSFNGEGIWHGTGPQSAGDPLARLSPWRKVMAKAKAEGFF